MEMRVESKIMRDAETVAAEMSWTLFYHIRTQGYPNSSRVGRAKEITSSFNALFIYVMYL